MRPLFFFLLCLLFVKAISQVNSVDSLKAELASVKGDTTRANLLYEIGNSYRFFDYDSALHYAMLSLDASGTGHPAPQARAYNLGGLTLRYKGNYTMAIEFHLKALQLSEKNNLPVEMYRSLQGLSMIYKDMGDYKQALDYGYRAQTLDDKTADGGLITAANLGDLYARMNRYDSALFYENMAYRLNLTEGNDYTKSFTLETLANIQEKLGHRNLAIEYLILSINHARAGNLKRELTEACNSLADILSRDNQYDSAYHYAHEALFAAKDASYRLGEAAASGVLQEYFEKRGIMDSALFYYKLSVDTKDEILNEEKVRQIQNLQFNEQVRLQEAARAAAEEREKRKQNLQFIGITLFLMLFFTIVATLGKRKVKPGLIDFLSTVALLLLFEFVALLLHPLVGSLTHHQPVFMLLILVCVASIIVPLHHRLEIWLKKKIGTKPSKDGDASTESSVLTDKDTSTEKNSANKSQEEGIGG
jgi:tetratricopeptide (TPR) repeat protein